ncbi:MAG: DNA mismatch repair endonuclease MutL [Rikenellaceae bacterium]|nr:DNA mismatch repair endonuclease MutL [Rikenellaceae bacterium]
MAHKIQLLPEVVANQIAAGEVVNRPASVVKEMMENAIDAGATCVKVNFRDGGKELIQIVDDGCGMSAIDARLAFDRHATSKIRSVEDIYALRTFGFRGEALASIAAVSQVELRTRQAEDEVGTLTEIHGGAFIAQQPVACPVGSQFCVRNLFYNVPARRHFLEKSTTSTRQIKCEFQRVALCHPEIGFELYANDAPIYQLRAQGLAGRIVDLVGRSIKQNLLEVDASTSIASVKGYIGRPAAAKQRNQDQFLFVNGRYFKSAYLVSALLRAYDKLIPATAQPSFFLFLEIDPSRIDVNVHPQKTEVKFADEEAVWQIVNAAVRETLAKSGSVPMMDFDAEQSVEIPVLQHGAIYNEPSSIQRSDYNPFNDNYIDPSAPDPNKNYRGFDVPFDGGSGSAPRLSDAGFAAPRPSTPSFGGFAPNEEFEDFRSMASLAGGFQLEEQPAEEPYEEFASVASGNWQTSEAEQGNLPVVEKPAFRDAVQLGGALAVAHLDEGVVLIDLRRARERLLYEEYLQRSSASHGVSQQLLFPEQLTFSKEEYRLLLDHEVELALLGFDLRFGDAETIEVAGLPAEMAPEELESVLYALLQLYAEPAQSRDVLRERTAKLMAVGGAKRMPKVVSREELESLLERLAACSDYSFSPQGKAILAPLRLEELRALLG